MGEVLCIAKGDLKKLQQWLDAKAGRYAVWVDADQSVEHPRIYRVEDNELMLQQTAAQLLYLPFVYEDNSHPVLQKLARIQTEIHYRASDFLDQGITLLTNYKLNLQQEAARASDYFGRFADIPAIVCGAGPSIKETIPLLKENRGHFLIIGCGAGMQALLAAGIEPHLAVHVDPDPYHQFPKTTIPLFYQLRTSHEVVSQMKGPHFLMAGAGEFHLERWIEEKLGLESSSDGGWTATTRGVSLATCFGCKEIYLAGIDFSASKDVYAKGVENPPDGTLMQVTLPDGSIVQTRSDWLLAAEWLNEWTQKHPDRTWGILSKPNPLLPCIPSLPLPPQKNRMPDLFSDYKPRCGKEIWAEISQKLKECQTLVEQFLAHFQTVFPQSPTSDTTCLKLLEEIDQLEIVRLMVDPIWSHWEVVFKREPDTHPDALIIHRILLIHSLCSKNTLT